MRHFILRAQPIHFLITYLTVFSSGPGYPSTSQLPVGIDGCVKLLEGYVLRTTKHNVSLDLAELSKDKESWIDHLGLRKILESAVVEHILEAHSLERRESNLRIPWRAVGSEIVVGEAHGRIKYRLGAGNQGRVYMIEFPQGLKVVKEYSSIQDRQANEYHWARPLIKDLNEHLQRRESKDRFEIFDPTIALPIGKINEIPGITERQKSDFWAYFGKTELHRLVLGKFVAPGNIVVDLITGKFFIIDPV